MRHRFRQRKVPLTCADTSADALDMATSSGPSRLNCVRKVSGPARLEEQSLHVLVQRVADPLVPLEVAGVWAGRVGVDVVAGIGTHPLVTTEPAVGAGADRGDAVGVVEVAATVLVLLSAPAAHPELAGRRRALVLVVELQRRRRAGGGSLAPPLLGVLAGGSETAGDLTPGVPGGAKAGDRDLGGEVQLLAQCEQVDQPVDIAVGDPSSVRPDDTHGEGGVVGVLDIASATLAAPDGPGRRLGRAAVRRGVDRQAVVDVARRRLGAAPRLAYRNLLRLLWSPSGAGGKGSRSPLPTGRRYRRRGGSPGNPLLARGPGHPQVRSTSPAPAGSQGVVGESVGGTGRRDDRPG